MVKSVAMCGDLCSFLLLVLCCLFLVELHVSHSHNHVIHGRVVGSSPGIATISLQDLSLSLHQLVYNRSVRCMIL